MFTISTISGLLQERLIILYLLIVNAYIISFEKNTVDFVKKTLSKHWPHYNSQNKFMH